jgi:hypothetical protein
VFAFGWHISKLASRSNMCSLLLTTAATKMRNAGVLSRRTLCLIITVLMLADSAAAQWDVCALFGDRPLPFGTRDFCTATGLADKGSSENNGCMILGVMEEALQGLSSAPRVCSAARQVPAAAVSLNGEELMLSAMPVCQPALKAVSK